eukprot:Nk52_evm5s62 gene=Nk52_evmTU5s62
MKSTNLSDNLSSEAKMLLLQNSGAESLMNYKISMEKLQLEKQCRIIDKESRLAREELREIKSIIRSNNIASSSNITHPNINIRRKQLKEYSNYEKYKQTCRQSLGVTDVLRKSVLESPVRANNANLSRSTSNINSNGNSRASSAGSIGEKRIKSNYYINRSSPTGAGSLGSSVTITASRSLPGSHPSVKVTKEGSSNGNSKGKYSGSRNSSTTNVNKGMSMSMNYIGSRSYLNMKKSRSRSCSLSSGASEDSHVSQ